MLRDVVAAAQQARAARARAWCASPLRGGHGNREYLLWVRRAGRASSPDPSDLIDLADARGHRRRPRSGVKELRDPAASSSSPTPPGDAQVLDIARGVVQQPRAGRCGGRPAPEAEQEPFSGIDIEPVVPSDPVQPADGLRARRRPRWRRHDPARRRARPRARTPRCSGSTSATSASSPRPSARRSTPRSPASSTRDYTVEERMTLDVVVPPDGRAEVDLAGPSTRPRVEKAARERMLEVVARGRRPPAVDLGVRRHRRLDAHGVHRLRVLRRRPRRVARRRGPARRPDQRPRPLRPAPRGRPVTRTLAVEVLARHRGPRRRVGATGGGRSTCPPGARVEVHARRRARCGSPGSHAAPFTDRLVAKFDLPVRGLARPVRP